MLPANYNLLMDARYAAFRANDVPAASPDTLKNWINGRRTFIVSQIPNATFNVPPPAATSTSNYITITGTAPVTAKDVLVNGAEYPITWTSVTAWSLRVPLTAGDNTLVIAALDRFGNNLGSRTSTSITRAPCLRRKERGLQRIMFNPPWMKLVRGSIQRASDFCFDLSGGA
jgi:hypothetical protein